MCHHCPVLVRNVYRAGEIGARAVAACTLLGVAVLADVAGFRGSLLSSLSTAGWGEVKLLLPYAIVTWVVLLAHRRVLDVLSVGDDEAASLGVDVGRVRIVIVVAATVGTAAAVAVSGLIAFVGIIVPHTVRLLVSTSYRAVLPLSLLAGAGFLALPDVLSRTVLSPQELPIGVITAFFGAPFFAFVLARSR